jgi:hypothetical protein
MLHACLAAYAYVATEEDHHARLTLVLAFMVSYLGVHVPARALSCSTSSPHAHGPGGVSPLNLTCLHGASTGVAPPDLPYMPQVRLE